MSDATGGDAATDRGRHSGNSFLGDVAVNFKRWSLKSWRSRLVLAATFVQPIVFLLLFTQVFGGIATGAISQIGVQVDYITFLLPAIAMQVALVAASSSGVGLVNDMEQGMFEKVLVSPMGRTAVFLGKSAAEMVLIVVQITLIMVLGLALGVTIETGPAGIAGVALVGILFSVWYTAFSNIVAVVTRDQESTIIGANFVQFPLLFVSTAFLPLSALPTWITYVAALNPVTYGVDAARALVLGRDVHQILEVSAFGGMWDTVVPAVGVLVAVDLVFGGLAVYMLRRASRAKV